MNTRSRFIVLALLALVVLCDAEAQKLRGIKPRLSGLHPQDVAQMFGGAQSPLDRTVPASAVGAITPRPQSNNLLGRRLLVPQQYATIQTAIDSAVHGDSVLVSNGTYNENINFRGKAIVVASYMILDNDTSHRNNTIIRANQPSSNANSVVSFVSGEDTTSIIYGFTITGGTGTVSGANRVGGGVYCYLSGPRIVHNKIINNSTNHSGYARGGGIGTFPFGNNVPAVIEHNIIAANSCVGGEGGQAGGIYMPHGRIDHNIIRGNSCRGQVVGLGGGIHGGADRSVQRHLLITNNIIENNQAVATGSGRGGGIDTWGGIVVSIIGNTIRNNYAQGVNWSYGGGIDLAYAKAPSVIRGNTISFNSVSLAVGYGGGIALPSTEAVTIAENVIEGNSGAFVGGGIYCSESSPITIAGNLFKRNYSLYGGGVFGWATNLLVANNILVGNTGRWWGGAIAVSQDTSTQSYLLRIISNTITGNVADTGGAIGSYWGRIELINTICWGDTAPYGPEIDIWGGTLNAAYSDIRFGRDSIAIDDSSATINWLSGNITSNPTFRDTTMRLADTSPCIGGAVDSVQIDGVWLHAPPFCIYGMPRPTPAGTRPDIGACENPNGPPALPQWQLRTTLSGNPPLYSISTVNDRVAWIGSYDTVYITMNSGTNWIPTPTSPTTIGDIAYIKALSADTAFVGGGGPGLAGGNARIYRTTNGGQTWSIVYTAAGTASYWNAIHFFDAQNAIAMSDPPNPGSSFLIIKSSDAGVTWAPIANPPIPNPNEYGTQNMFFFDSFNGWFGTGPIVSPANAGRVFRTTDGGNSWTGYPSGNNGWVSDVLFVSPMVGIRTSYTSPFVTRSTDGGQTWDSVTNLPVTNIWRMYFGTVANTPRGSQLWVSGLTQTYEAFILTSTDRGGTWNNQPLPALPPRHVPRLSAASFGARNDSVQIFGGTMDFSISDHGGEILSYRQVTTAVEERTNLPTGYSLSQNYPNPFNPSTNIKYQVPSTNHVTLKVFDILGREVAALVDEVQDAGYKSVQWDALDIASGVYFYRLQAGDFVATRRLVLLR